ncbi:MAG: hypothetical protein KF774_02425 [Planctomyces sp.]|nr:hypothetical protein [Planctomyces sp.]
MPTATKTATSTRPASFAKDVRKIDRELRKQQTRTPDPFKIQVYGEDGELVIVFPESEQLIDCAACGLTPTQGVAWLIREQARHLGDLAAAIEAEGC